MPLQGQVRLMGSCARGGSRVTREPWGREASRFSFGSTVALLGSRLGNSGPTPIRARDRGLPRLAVVANPMLKVMNAGVGREARSSSDAGGVCVLLGLYPSAELRSLGGVEDRDVHDSLLDMTEEAASLASAARRGGISQSRKSTAPLYPWRTASPPRTIALCGLLVRCPDRNQVLTTPTTGAPPLSPPPPDRRAGMTIARSRSLDADGATKETRTQPAPATPAVAVSDRVKNVREVPSKCVRHHWRNRIADDLRHWVDQPGEHKVVIK